MKYLYTLAICLIITSCNKDKNAPQAKSTQGTQSTSSGIYDPKWIPNWFSGDTLYGVDQDTNGQYVPIDTMFTAKIGDTTCIFYHGVKYYLWTSTFYNTISNAIDTFEDNQKIYSNCYIGTIPFDTANGIKDHGIGTAVWPHKYQKDDGTWVHREQLIMVHNYQNFADVLMNQYRSENTY